MTNTEKAQENRMRRMAKRRGYELTRNRVRDPYAVDYGCYYLHRDGKLVDKFGSLNDLVIWMPGMTEKMLGDAGGIG